MILTPAQAEEAPQALFCNGAAATPVLWEAAPETTQLRAQQADATASYVHLRGAVEVQTADRMLWADEVYYDRTAERVDAAGNVRFLQGGELELVAESGSLEIAADRGRFEHTKYELYPRNARGSAQRIEVLDADHTRLEDMRFTTCRPENPTWELRARRLDFDRVSGDGEGRGVTLRVKGIPIAYVPWIRFPIDERRKSGVLAPTLGHSEQTGADIEIPYYWNIAPQRDATITPRLLSRRGLQLNVEYRYLQESGRGRLAAAGLPDDDVFGDDRAVVSYEQQGRWGGWYSDVNLNHASDRQYFEDLGNSLSLSSTTHLERRIDFGYENPEWRVVARAQDFQPLGDTALAYQRLPQLSATGRVARGRLHYLLDAEAVRFDHREPLVTGTRVDLTPGLGYRLERPGYFLRPTAQVRYTSYHLDPLAASEPRTLSRTTPIASLDTGLVFERDTRWRGRGLLHTLEPRLFYLYVPERRQDELPVFDTGDLDFGFFQLFRTNRFSGPDRQGDANQLSVALTSRWLDALQGEELGRVSVGQIYHYTDRNVALPGGRAATRNRSDLLGELALRLPGPSYLSLAGQWDPERERTTRTTIQYQLRSPHRHLFNAAYRYRRDELEQVDVSAFLPIARRWRLMGRWNYSLLEERSLESLAGLEYESCCWKLRLVGRRHITEQDLLSDPGIQLQFVFKGLAPVGSRVDRLLEDSILGYSADEDVQ